MVLRPWQALVAELALTLESDRLAFRTVVVSTPRQSGKSWLIKAMAMFRAAHPHLFGDEPQKVVHVANRHLAARRIHSQSWGWAGRRGLDVRTAQGMERIIWPDESSWDALTLSSVYGESANLVMLDEVWDVSGEDYREGLRPTQVARTWPQMWALSTAHRRATGLMLELMAQGRRGEGRVLLADWGAPARADQLDPGVWEAASPYWDAQREEEMRLAAGSAGFAEQWLNVWPTAEVGGSWLPGWWRRRADLGRPVAAGVEAAYGAAPVLAVASVDGDRVVVSVVQCDSVADAASRAAALGVPTSVGKSLLHDPAWALTDAEGVALTGSRAIVEFRRLFDDGVLWHDGSPVLADQVAGCEAVFSPDGARVVSRNARLDGIKAAVWAVQAARSRDSWFVL